ncbi:hypothetical protein Syn7502_02833 [Synechococcus sp. PCC 7502]|uniref:hypothetical protein n=1 Tax=Synechococcus sp. PCC 7502 TaxID=1173263 RepID=UPI00029F9EE8|nr:hypothetical protein [Synechococcus sp. PCC 7502]AFY74770.1 hypothetical protein Syn7502_02833 [Synechococcus sp. PCC 7502]
MVRQINKSKSGEAGRSQLVVLIGSNWRLSKQRDLLGDRKLIIYPKISMMIKFHRGYFFLMAASTSDSVGLLLVTCTDVVVVELGVPPVDEYLILTLTDTIDFS